MGEGDFRGLQRESGKRLLGEEGRGGKQRMNRRADVVRKAGKRQLLGAPATTGCLCPLVYVLCMSGARKREDGGETIRTGADDDRVWSDCRCATRTHRLVCSARVVVRGMLTIAARSPARRRSPLHRQR